MGIQHILAESYLDQLRFRTNHKSIELQEATERDPLAVRIKMGVDFCYILFLPQGVAISESRHHDINGHDIFSYDDRHQQAKVEANLTGRGLRFEKTYQNWLDHIKRTG